MTTSSGAKRPSLVNIESEPQYCRVSGFEPNAKPQVIAALIACIGAFGLGTVIGWSSPALPSLKASGDLGEIYKTEESWIGSLVALGAVTSSLFVRISMHKLGRKYTILLLQIPLLFGWILLATASSVGMVLVGRLLTGIAGGAMTLIVPIYISEIAEDRIRGTLCSFMVFAICLGVLFSYSLGSVVSWKLLSIISAAVPILGFSIFFMPDTPNSLLARDKEHEAQRALVWFRGATSFKKVENEMEQIQVSLDESRQHSCSISDLLVRPVVKPIGISLGLMFFQQFAGINAVLFYSVEIFKSAGTDIDPNISAIVLGTIRLFVTIPSIILIDRLGRKPILVFAEAGIVVCLTALGIFFHLKAQNDNQVPEGLGWLPLVSLILYMAFMGFGMTSLPWILLGELVPNHIKGFAGGLGNSFCWGVGFLVGLAFGPLCESLTTQGCYWLFAGISLVGTAFCLFIVPETKGKSLDEINALFK